MVKKNMAANLLAKLYIAIISFIVLPIYLEYLGAESYGLVGVFGMIQALALLLDSGIRPMVTREIARVKDRSDEILHLNILFHTTEIIMLLIGIVVVFIIYITAPYIATQWLNINQLSLNSVINTVGLIGVLIGFRFSIGLFGGVIMALEKQVVYNIALSIIATLKSVGAVIVLEYVSSDIETFFKFQILIAIIEFFLYRTMLTRYMPKCSQKSFFSLKIYKNNLNFIGGYSLSMIFIFLLLQSGNIVLSKILPLKEFGYYTLAIGIVSILQKLGTPLFQAILPRLIAIYANDKKNLLNFYHKACQTIAFFVIPIGLVLSLYSFDIIFLWTQNEITTNNIYLIVSLLSIGTLLNILATMPGQLQVADGRTKTMVYINAFSIFFILPMNIIFGKIYGGVGVAIVWIILNILYLLAGVFLVHSYLLDESKMTWIMEDIVKPLIFIGIFLLFSRYAYIFLNFQSSIIKLIYIFIVLVVSYIINAYILSAIRPDIIKIIHKLKVKL